MFDYVLPPEKIAQYPLSREGERSDSKLLQLCVMPDGAARINDLVVRDLPELLSPGDLLVLNNTRVRRARFFALHPRTGREVEVFLLGRVGEISDAEGGGEKWDALARPQRILREGDTLQLGPTLRAFVGTRSDDGRRITLSLSLDRSETNIEDTVSSAVEREGLLPIPPYIRGGRSEEIDNQLYQTVYGQEPGSLAAPTAGLHFTEQLLTTIAARGVEVKFVTLHMGVGSFQQVENIESHTVPSEWLSVSADTLEALERVKSRGGRVVAVGTTVVRTLETVPIGQRTEFQGTTSLIVRPGHRFRRVDALFTNFHQPKSTHLYLVAAFVGEPALKAAYRHGLANGYRFLSYGDAMFCSRS